MTIAAEFRALRHARDRPKTSPAIRACRRLTANCCHPLVPFHHPSFPMFMSPPNRLQNRFSRPYSRSRR